MSISFSKPPAESDDVLRRGLGRISQTHASGETAKAIGGAVDPKIVTSPHPVFSAGLDQLKAGGGVGSARPDGWRYFVGSSGPLKSAEVGPVGDSAGYSFRELNTGPFNEGMLQTLQAIQNEPQLKGGDFEVRLFRANAVMVAAIWLKNKGGGTDLFVPLKPTPPPLEAGHIYDTGAFNNLLTTIAKAKRVLEPPMQSPATLEEGG